MSKQTMAGCYYKLRERDDMSNSFVSYLNSLNSADANGSGALAEAQVTSDYFDKVLVRRALSEFLLNLVARPCTIILTGHAGDGKTSLLIQLLKDLDCHPVGQQLMVSAEVTAPKGVKLFYVKDMSELNHTGQENLLKQALRSPDNGSSAVLVSNTGPLINTLRRINAHLSKDELDSLTTLLLEKLDSNDGQPIELLDYSVYIVNVARIENVNFARQLLDRMLQGPLWEQCTACVHHAKCPIYHNQVQCRASYSQVAEFLSTFYRYLSEHDKRLTIRQITAHVSYALTGNLSCTQVAHSNNTILFDYHFSNLLFGYVGFDMNPKASQIKAIAELQGLGLDTVCLDTDYALFVRQEYDVFSDEVAKIVKMADSRAATSLRQAPPNEKADIRTRHRRYIRRMYILFSPQDNRQHDRLFAQLYSPVYPLYLKAISGQNIDRDERRSLATLILKALYVIFVGMPNSDPTGIPLTVRRSGAVTQYVQLLQGTVPASDLTVVPTKVASAIDTSGNACRLELGVKKLDQNHVITFPLLDYFWHVANGSVATSLAPALSHGIDRLKSQLVEAYTTAPDKEKKDLKLLLFTNRGAREARIHLEDGELNVYWEGLTCTIHA